MACGSMLLVLAGFKLILCKCYIYIYIYYILIISTHVCVFMCARIAFVYLLKKEFALDKAFYAMVDNSEQKEDHILTDMSLSWLSVYYLYTCACVCMCARINYPPLPGSCLVVKVRSLLFFLG